MGKVMEEQGFGQLEFHEFMVDAIVVNQCYQALLVVCDKEMCP